MGITRQESSRKYYLKHRDRILADIVNRNARAKKWRDKNPGLSAQQHMDYRLAHPERTLLDGARLVALNTRVPFGIVESDVVIPVCCPVLGIPLISTTGKGSRNDSSPCLDYIVPRLGYVPGNVAVVSWRAKRIKHSATIRELIKIGRFYYETAILNSTHTSKEL